MCGILGQITFDGREASIPQLDLLQHRGPDGQGEWTNQCGNIYLGHTRLAILDPTPAGQQPMTDSTGRFTITFNGEIYNHLELRSLLPDVEWRGTADTETLLELLSVRGLDALDLLKGMFAFALYDSLEDSLLLVRDRLGIKPLWYSINDSCLRFSSEVRALVSPENSKISSHALSEYIGFGRMPAVGPIYKGIQAVPSGNWIKVNSAGLVHQKSWWPSKEFPSLLSKRTDQAALPLKQLVTKAIEEHLISDVGVGSFLSGGIDSSIVTLVAGASLGKNLKTFTVGFPQNAFDERAVGRQVAKQAGSDHSEIEVSPERCLDWVKDAVFSLDLPSVDAINTYIVSRAVKDSGLKVALSGLGGDEIFGGYPSFTNIPRLQIVNLFPKALANTLLSYAPDRLKDKIHGLDSFSIADLTVAHRRFTSIAALKEMGFNGGIPGIPPSFNLDKMGQISWAEIYGYMIPMLLRDSDQMSMAVGLEIRVPFLDHHLVEVALGLSRKFKKGKGVKPLLIKAFKDELPPEVYNRPKQGFVLPMNEWIRGPLAGFAEEGVLSAADILSLTEPLQHLAAFQRGKLHWTRVWLWVVLGHWLSRQKEAVPLEVF